MNLRELIEELKKCPPDSRVYADGAAGLLSLDPMDMASYRGYYEDLAIPATIKGPSTVAHFIDCLEMAIGAIYEGYKGGEYVVSESTDVWIASWGEASGCRVTGVRVAVGAVFLEWEREKL